MWIVCGISVTKITKGFAAQNIWKILSVGDLLQLCGHQLSSKLGTDCIKMVIDYKQTSNIKFSFTLGGKCLILLFELTRVVRASTILLCSLRKSVCIEVRVGWMTARTSPLVRSSPVGKEWGDGGMSKPH